MSPQESVNKPCSGASVCRIWRTAASGVTLVELLVVLVVVGIVTTIAVPAFTGILSSIKLQSASDTFFASLLLTRSEAIKRNSRSVMCKSAGGLQCDLSGGWEQGWIVFGDINNNARVDMGEVILLRQTALAPPISFVGNRNVAQYVSYTSTGTTRLKNSAAFQAGTFTICANGASGKSYAKQIVISSAGRPRVERTPPTVCP